MGMEASVKNHSKETKNVSKNDYGFTQEKRKNSVFHNYLCRCLAAECGIFMNKILVVEDEEAIAALIRMNLTKAGYQCDLALSGDKGADMLSENNYDLCLFDIMLPGFSGYELLSYAKSLEIPVIFVTAKGTVEDKVKGLKSGADDYITKPFEVLELLARVENVLRRFNKTGRYINIAGLQIDTTARIVKKHGETLKLTYKEYDLLLLFTTARMAFAMRPCLPITFPMSDWATCSSSTIAFSLSVSVTATSAGLSTSAFAITSTNSFMTSPHIRLFLNPGKLEDFPYDFGRLGAIC